MRCAVNDINAAGGIDGRAMELVVRDTAGDALRGTQAVKELVELGVIGFAGEYHSVVARAIAAGAIAYGLPYLCSSAVLDGLTDEPTDLVARIAPVQSEGWRAYARFLIAEGHKDIAIATAGSVYWNAGEQILRREFLKAGGTVTRLPATARGAPAIIESLIGAPLSALLVLTGYPEPAVSLVRLVRGDPRLSNLRLGAPAGQPEFQGWLDALAADGAGIPFLRYLPSRFTQAGRSVERRLRAHPSASPSFVAYEGYDTIAVLANFLSSDRSRAADMAAYWGSAEVSGTRGHISFERRPRSAVWEHRAPPIQIAERNIAEPGSFRVLRAPSADPLADNREPESQRQTSLSMCDGKFR